MISVVQSFTEKISSTNPSLPIRFRYPSAIGNAIAVVIKWVGQNSIMSVTDNVGNAYIAGPSASIESGSNMMNLQIWYAFPITAVAGTIIQVTVTFS